MSSFVRLYAAMAAVALALLAGCATHVNVDEQPTHTREPVSLEDQLRHNIVNTAMETLGVPYRWGGTGMKEGFDCSGLIYFVYTKNGASKKAMPRVTTQMAKGSESVDRSELKPGDLVFFNTLGRRFSHVGLYIGSGMFINAPSKGKRVRIDSIDAPYYKKRFTGGRRLAVIETVLANTNKVGPGGQVRISLREPQS